MYDLKSFEKAEDMLDYLNSLGAHEIIWMEHPFNYLLLVKISRIGRPPKAEAELKPMGFPNREE